MPLGLCWQEANVVDPIGTRFESDDFDVIVSELESDRLIVGHELGCRRYVPDNVRVNAGHVLQSVLLHLILVIVRSEYVIHRKLTFNALSLEVLWELDRYTVREGIAMVKLDISIDVELVSCVDDANLELVLVVDEGGHVVVVAAPAVRDFLRLRAVHQDVHTHVVTIQDLLELLLDLRRDGVHVPRPRVYPIDEVNLFLDVRFFLNVLGLQCFFIDVVAVQHGQPLEPRHELVDGLAHLVAVGAATSVDQHIILSEQTLRLQIDVLHVQAALAELCFRIRAILGDCLVEVVLLSQALSSVHRLLDAVLDLAVEEHGIFTGLHLLAVH